MADENNLANTAIALEGIANTASPSSEPLANPSALTDSAGISIQLSEN